MGMAIFNSKNSASAAPAASAESPAPA